MKFSLSELRRIIREQVATMVFVHPTIGGMGGVSGLKRHKEQSPPGLGDEGEQEQELYDDKEQEEFQWTVGARERKDGQRR